MERQMARHMADAAYYRGGADFEIMLLEERMMEFSVLLDIKICYDLIVRFLTGKRGTNEGNQST